MKTIGLIRGKYLNNYEGQNYIFSQKDIQVVGISSLFPIHHQFPFSTIKLFSLTDIESLPLIKNIPLFGRAHKFITNRAIGDAQYLFNLEKTISSFDLCLTADPHYYFSYQLAMLRKTGRIGKLVVTSWETIPFNNETVYAKKHIKHEVLRYADSFLCYTEKAKSALIAEGVAKNTITVIRLGVNINTFKRLTSHVKQRAITILFVGRLVEEKGVMEMYEAYKQIQNSKVKSQNYKLKLKIIGEGQLKQKIQKQIKRDELGDSVSIETKTYNEMPEVYRSADIFVLPSRKTKTWEEQYGMVLVEAMASSLPIVANKSGAIPEIIGDTGILVEEGDRNSLTNALHHLVANKNLRIKLGTMGRRRVETIFDSRKTAKQLKRFIMGLCQT